MPLDQNEAIKLLGAKWGKVAYSAPTTPILCRLMSSNGTSTSNGTVVANAGGSTYTAQDVSAATPATTSAAVAEATSGGARVTSNAAITFTNMPALTVVGVELWDSAGTPRRTTFGALTVSKTTALGDSLTISSGSLTDTLA